MYMLIYKNNKSVSPSLQNLENKSEKGIADIIKSYLCISEFILIILPITVVAPNGPCLTLCMKMYIDFGTWPEVFLGHINK